MGQGKLNIGLASACAMLALSLPASAAGSSGCAHANQAATSAPTPAMQQATVCLINQQREARGLPAVRVSAKLNTVAQRWTHHMVTHDQFSHARFIPRIDAVHYPWQVAAENIATGYLTPRAAVAAWMASPDHCRNLLDPSVRDVGTGERPAPVRHWASSPATWTQDFGLRADQPPPSHDRAPAAGCPY